MGWLEEADGVMKACTDADAFGEEVSYTPSKSSPGTSALAIRGVFSAAHEVIDMSGDAPISAVAPALGIRLSDFGGIVPAQGDKPVVVRGRSYKVYDTQPDGQAGMTLILKEI